MRFVKWKSAISPRRGNRPSDAFPSCMRCRIKGPKTETVFVRKNPFRGFDRVSESRNDCARPDAYKTTRRSETSVTAILIFGKIWQTESSSPAQVFRKKGSYFSSLDTFPRKKKTSKRQSGKEKLPGPGREAGSASLNLFLPGPLNKEKEKEKGKTKTWKVKRDRRRLRMGTRFSKHSVVKLRCLCVELSE